LGVSRNSFITTTSRLATLPMSPVAATPPNPNSKSSPVVSVAEGVMQGPVEEQGSGGSTITCETEGLGSGKKGGKDWLTVTRVKCLLL